MGCLCKTSSPTKGWFCWLVGRALTSFARHVHRYGAGFDDDDDDDDDDG